MPTIDNILAARRRQRELAGDVRPADRSDLLTRLTPGAGGGGGTGLPTIDELLGLGLDDGGGGGYGGGYSGGGAGGAGGALDTGMTEAARLASEQQFTMDQATRDAMAIQAQKDREMIAAAQEAEKQRVFERQQALETLRAERQKMFVDMLGKDPVRAVLFAMGIGDEAEEMAAREAGLQDPVGGVPADTTRGNVHPLAGPVPGAAVKGGVLVPTSASRGLPPLNLAGAPTPKEMETSLSALFGGKIGLGQAGVTGLPSAIKAAGAYSAGQGASGSVGNLDAARTLLTSALGVGATKGKGRPGISRKEQLRKIGSVTPQGVFGV